MDIDYCKVASDFMIQGEYKISTGIEAQRKEAAEDVLLTMLYGGFPVQDKGLAFLYGTERLPIVYPIIGDFRNEVILPLLASGKQVRHLDDITLTEIYKKKNALSNPEQYRQMESALSAWTIPKRELFVEQFGEYADFVIKNFNEFNRLKKTRRCDLQYTKHLSRTGDMAKEIGFDFASGMPAYYFAALWALHDSVEELVYSIRDSNGKIKYGLERIPEFLNDFIPKDMHEDIMMISNISDLILKYLDAKGNSMNTKKDMDYAIAIIANGHKYDYVREDAVKMREILDKLHLKSGRDSFFEAAKWEFYEKKFLNDLGEEAYAKNHFALFEGKGVLDIFDNYVGRHSRSLDDRRNSILKLVLWANKSEELIARANSTGKTYPATFESKVVEVMNHANYGARDLLIQYLSQPMAHIDHLRSALVSIEKFKNILYTDKTRVIL